MTADESGRDLLRKRLARLGPDQVVELVLNMQARIDQVRAGRSAEERAPIAVVGLGCRFPRAGTVEEFRRLLFDGIDAIGAPPPDRPDAAGLAPAGYLDAIDRFDADFFGVRDAEAATMDPQHRLLLEVAWHALEDAGYADAGRRPRGTGVFLGLSTSDYEVRFRDGLDRGLSPQAITGNARSIAAGRLAHWLNTTGPALTVDTACSSSLVAVHVACLALRSGACDLAIAGGVNALFEADMSHGFEAAGMLSPDHACKTFDAAANGYVRGEGVGIVILKRLPDATHDRDRVRAIVRGSAINHDGRASSLTAPNGLAQVEVIRAALRDAGLAPQEVQAVECHGTGTPLGDPIEVQALAEAYRANGAGDLLLGAVKTNIGHLEAAAGIAGLIKATAALESGRLPPTLHQRDPNPRIAWRDLPVHVIDRPTDWPDCETRRSGVSSFGFSGTNAHVILEAAPASADTAVPSRTIPCYALSAPDERGLARLAASVADAVAARPDLDPAQFAATLAVERARFSERAAIVNEDREGLVADLRAIADGHHTSSGARGKAPATTPKIAFLFTGQGSQWAGMGRDLYADDPFFRDIVDECAAVLDPRLPAPLTELMFEPANEDRLRDTAVAQPALFTLEYALAKRLQAWGLRPEVMIGHSLGEMVAACLAGVFSLEDALELVAERGRLMGSMPRNGTMAAVFAAAESLVPLLAADADRVNVAAFNAADETVVSGEATAVDRVCDALEAKGIGCQRLRVSHAFHSAMMEPAVDEFRRFVANRQLSEPRIPIVSNLTGTTDAPMTDPGYWARLIREPVRFADGLAAVLEHGATVLIEVGATPALIGLAQRSSALEGRNPSFAPTLRRNKPARLTLARMLAGLFVAGVAVDWDEIMANIPRAPLPGYPFADRRFWVPRTDVARTASATSKSSPPPRVEPGRGAEPPDGAGTERTDLRGSIREFLARRLQLDSAAIDADVGFFELGVDSLALTETVAALERRWQVAIPRQTLFETLTTAPRLIEYVAEAASKHPDEATDRGQVQQIATATAPPAETGSGLAGTPAEPVMNLDQRARRYLDDFSRDYVRRSARSRREREDHGKSLADSRAIAGFRPETKSMLYPIVGARGRGSHVTDVDGNEYVDVTMGFGVQLFGHNPPFVIEAIEHHLGDQGLFMGPQAALAGEVAERISRITGNQRVLFCNTGTEAVMTALRLARHGTGRSRIAMFAGSYHGHFDGTLAGPSLDGRPMPLAGGTPQGMIDDILVLDYDDPDGSLEALAEVADSLAGVIVEPVQSRRPGLQPRDFLNRLRGFTEACGAALIFDEVLLGFRVALGGAQAWAGVRADLVTYGKIVGGGLPIGVVGGRDAFLDAIDGGDWSFEGDRGPRASRTFFAGTFNKNPLTMATAKAILDHLETAGPALQEMLNARTASLCARLNAVFKEENAPLSVDHFASMFRFAGASDLFFYHLIQHGVYVWEGRTCFLSTAHTDVDLDEIEAAVRASVRDMERGGLMARRARAGPVPERTPLTPGQHALWVLAAFSPETSAAYNQSLVLDLTGPLDSAALERALQDLVERHDSLRMTFAPEGDFYEVRPPGPIPLRRAALEGTADEASADWLKDEMSQPFDLAAGSPLRAHLLQVSDDRHKLVLVQPHIVTDGWSMQVLATDLGELYSAYHRSATPPLPPAASYRVFADYVRTHAENPEAAAHWKGTYASVPAPLDLPTDRPRPKLQTYAGDVARVIVPATLVPRLEARARGLGCSLFTLCLAAYGRLLGRLSGQDDLAVAIFSAGQPLVGERSLTGFCVTTLPIRIRGAHSTAGSALAATVHRAMSDALRFPTYPFATLIKTLAIKRDPSRPPLASVSFNLDRVDAEPQFEGLSTDLEANPHGAVRWDLNWNMLLESERLVIEASYNRDLFDRGRVDTWVAAYIDILTELVDDETVPERRSPAIEAAAVETLDRRIAHWAECTPDAIAVRDREGTTGYGALQRMADALAQRLMGTGIAAGDRVAFRLPRGLGPVVAMTAASRIGAAFVPLDPEHPPAHHAHILKDSGARALISETDDPIDGCEVPIMRWRRDDTSDPTDHPPRHRPAPEEMAYILYTSGSTGRPKGVRVPWRAVATYASALLERLEIDQPTSFAMVTSFAADLGYTSVFGAFWSGGTLHAVDADTARDPYLLAEWFARSPVDVLKIVPTHLAAMMTGPDARRLLPRRALVLGGDVLTYPFVDRVRALGGRCRIYNHYGPTETTIGATMTEVTDKLRLPGNDAVPIGRPLKGYSVDIVDDDGAPVSAGEIGEILISGAGVAAGYVSQETNGGDRFGHRADGAASYLTGDLGRKHADGVIEFLGRKDEMVKIRGHRVEPDGIAALLRTHPGVRDAVVVVARPEGRDPYLVAAVASVESAEALGEWLSSRLPPAMCPARLFVRQSLPLTPNGKVDRAAILDEVVSPPKAGAAPPDLVAAETSGQTVIDTIRSIWSDVLGQESIGPDDDFFAIGGDSIMAIQIAGRARAVGLAISPTEIFEHSTPTALAAVATLVDSGAATRAAVHDEVPLAPIQSWFMDIDMPRRNHWALTAVFEAPSMATKDALARALAAAIDRHDALRTALVRDDGARQRIVAKSPEPFVIATEVTDDGRTALRRAEDALADRLIETLDLDTGRVVAAGLIERPSTAPPRIVVAAHHFIFDMVSWGVLAQDLGTALTENLNNLPPEPTAWTWWCAQLPEYAARLEDQAGYWRSVEQLAAGPIPLDRPDGANREGDAQALTFTLAADATGDLLASTADAYGLHAHETVLAAIGRALVRWTGATVALDLEGHGREPLDPSVDLSETIGWFTTRYPLVLPLAAAADPHDWLVAVKEAIRGLPKRGLGYGLLRRLGGASLDLDPQISFNFVGEIARFGGGTLPLVRLGAGRERDPEAARPHTIAITGWLDDGALTMRCEFGGQHEPSTIEALLDGFGHQTETFRTHCVELGRKVYTPGDFADIDFTQDELDQLVADVAEQE